MEKAQETTFFTKRYGKSDNKENEVVANHACLHPEETQNLKKS